MRRALLVVVVITFLCLVPASIAHALQGDGPGRWIFNGFSGLLLLILIIICVRWGRSLLQRIAALPEAKNETFKALIKQVR